MSFHTLSAILRGRWLLNKQWAESHMPLVYSLMRGESVDFGFGRNRKMYWDDDDDDDGRPHEPPAPELMAGTKKVYSVSRYDNLQMLPDGSIAMVSISGPMMKRGDWCSYGMLDHAALINRLAEATNVAGILLNIDSPGGQADGTALLAETIKNAGSTKPVLAIIDDGMAASAAMWVASAAQEIYVTQTTDQVGSVGVYTTIADWNTHYKEHFHLPVKDVYAPQSTDKNGDYNEAIKGNDEPLKEELAVLADQFINTVSANRSGKIKGDSWKTGKMFYAKDAQRIGLIDGIKSFSQVVRRMDSLISSKNNNSNSNNMAFEKTLKHANAESFGVTDEGFALQEEHLNAIESALTNYEQHAQTHSTVVGQLATANSSIAQLNGTIQQKDTLLQEANDKVTTLEQRVAELENEVAELGSESSGAGTTLTTTTEAEPGANGKPSWWMDDGSGALADKYSK